MVYLLATYYESICALIAYYLVQSFRDPLPWSYCRPEWGVNCIDSAPRSWLDEAKFIDSHSSGNWSLVYGNLTKEYNQRIISSSEFYFV